MTILDAELTFSVAQSVAAMNAADVLAATNTFDSGPIDAGNSASRDLGTGDPLIIQIICTTSLNAAATGTLSVRLVSDAALPIDGSSLTHWTSGPLDAVGASSTPGFVAGDITHVFVPMAGGIVQAMDQFWGFTFENLTADMIAGAFTIHIGRSAAITKRLATGMNF